MFHGSIVALVTPFRNGHIDERALGELIEWHIAAGTSGIVPTGTTGESPTLSHAEHDRVIELTVEAVARRVPVIAGTGSNATAEAIRLTAHAKAAGADAALIVTPYYNKPTQHGLAAHYRAIHDAVDLPMLIYNIPGRSVVDMAPTTMAELARLPNIVGVKDATGDIVRPLQTRALCGTAFCQLSGEDGNTLAFLAHGGHGCISVTANVAPHLCAQLHAAWRAGDAGAALDLHQRLLPLHETLFCESNPVPAKHALALLGKCTAEVRAPLAPLLADNRRQVEAALDAVGLAAQPAALAAGA